MQLMDGMLFIFQDSGSSFHINFNRSRMLRTPVEIKRPRPVDCAPSETGNAQAWQSLHSAVLS